MKWNKAQATRTLENKAPFLNCIYDSPGKIKAFMEEGNAGMSIGEKISKTIAISWDHLNWN